MLKLAMWINTMLFSFNLIYIPFYFREVILLSLSSAWGTLQVAQYEGRIIPTVKYCFHILAAIIYFMDIALKRVKVLFQCGIIWSIFSICCFVLFLQFCNSFQFNSLFFYRWAKQKVFYSKLKMHLNEGTGDEAL